MGWLWCSQKTESLSWRWKEIDLWIDAEVDMSDHVVLGAGPTSTYREKERRRQGDWKRGSGEREKRERQLPRFC